MNRNRKPRLPTAAVLGSLSLLLVAACGGGDSADSTQPGSDDPLGAGTGAIGTIEITITHPDEAPYTYTIGCTGDAFVVEPPIEGLDPQTACERLADPAVQARLVDGPPEDRVCTEIYGGPDLATITGELDGQQIDATIDRADGCSIDDWDTLLAGVLPRAVGVTG